MGNNWQTRTWIENFTFKAQKKLSLEPGVSDDINQIITLVHYFELHLGSNEQIQTFEIIFFQLDFA